MESYEWVMLGTVPLNAIDTLVAKGIYGEIHLRSRILARRKEKAIELIALTEPKNIVVYGYAQPIKDGWYLIRIPIIAIEREIGKGGTCEIAKLDVIARFPNVKELTKAILNLVSRAILRRYPTQTSWDIEALRSSKLWRELRRYVASYLKRIKIDFLLPTPGENLHDIAKALT